jgi:two-component system, NarL family, nitrate/nitrite response regulator NarL
VQKILIVDDHPLYREGMISALRTRMSSVEVLGTDSAEEGLQVLARDPEIDLVLIDVRLPGMDGFAALAMYGARFPGVSRVLISGSDEPAYLKRAFEGGASGYIPKSMAVQNVIAAIRKVLEGGVSGPEIVSSARNAEALDPVARLTLRQLEVLRLLGEGYTNKEIAKALDITERTAKAHVAAILEALDADNRTQAVLSAQRRGLLLTALERA